MHDEATTTTTTTETPVVPAAGGAPAAGAATVAAPGSGTPAAGAAETVQTPEQIKATADAEALRVSTLTPEQKAAEEKARPAEIKVDAPADYTALKLPEGYKTDPEDPVFGEALGLFKDLGLPTDGAQKLLDFTVKRDQALAQAINDHNAQVWNRRADGWKTATEKEFSAEDLGGAKAAAAQVFDKDTLAFLEGMKLTSNPGFCRAMVKISKAISEDTWVTGNAANGDARDARNHFPNSKMNP